MTRSRKSILILLTLVPFTCCGIPYAYLFAIAPVTYAYEPSWPVYHADGLDIIIFLRGEQDYAQNESEPRTVYLLAKQANAPIPDAFRVLRVDVRSSTGAIMVSHTPRALPALIPFDSTRVFASWKGDHTFDADLAAGESVAVTVEVEVTRGTTATIHTLDVTFQPRRIRRPISRLLPQV